MNKISEEYLKFQNDTSWFAHAGEDNAPELSYLVHGLNGESGEFTDEFKKITRKCGYLDKEEFHRLLQHPEHKRVLEKEIGDVLWYFNKILAFLDLDMDELMVMNTYKLYMRLKGRPEFKGLQWPFTDPDHSWEQVHKRYGGYLGD